MAVPFVCIKTLPWPGFGFYVFPLQWIRYHPNPSNHKNPSVSSQNDWPSSDPHGPTWAPSLDLPSGPWVSCCCLTSSGTPQASGAKHPAPDWENMLIILPSDRCHHVFCLWGRNMLLVRVNSANENKKVWATQFLKFLSGLHSGFHIYRWENWDLEKLTLKERKRENVKLRIEKGGGPIRDVLVKA